MLQSLPGADRGTEADGRRFTDRALELFRMHLTKPQRKKVTIAVSEAAGLEVAVVYHVNQQKADRIAGRLRKAGVAASSTSADDHAEVDLHKREPAVHAIGISNSAGPCSACKMYFANTPNGFANVYWDSQAWIRP